MCMFFFVFTVNNGLNAKPTIKFADQLTSTAMLDAGTRYVCVNNSAVISQGIEPGPMPKKATKTIVIANEILFQTVVDRTTKDINRIKLVTNIPPRPIKCSGRRPRRSMRKILMIVIKINAQPRPMFAYSAVC